MGVGSWEFGLETRDSGLGTRESRDSIFQGARQRNGKPKGRRTKNFRHPGAARSAEPGIHFDYTQFTSQQPSPHRQWIPDRGCAASRMTGDEARSTTLGATLRGSDARESGLGTWDLGLGTRESRDSIFQGARQRNGKPKGRRTKNFRHPGAARSAEPGIRFDYTQFTGKQPLPQRQWIPDRGCAASGMTGHLAGKPCARAARAGRLLLKRDARESPERAARPASNSRHRSPCAGRS